MNRIFVIDDEAAMGENIQRMLKFPETTVTAYADPLKGLADALGKGGVKSARERLPLAEHLAGKFLASPEGTRSATCGEWRGLVNALRKDLSPGMC